MTYHFKDGTKVTINVGDKSSDGRIVTKEDLKILITLHNKEIRNNIKNTRLPLDEKQRSEKHEWEDAHPGERYTGNYHASFDAFYGDDDEMDRSGLMLDAYSSVYDQESDESDRLWELINSMTPTQREPFIMVKIEGWSVKDTARELHKSEAAVCRAIKRGEDYIRKNY